MMHEHRTEKVRAGELSLTLHWRGNTLETMDLGWNEDADAGDENLSETGQKLARALKDYVAGKDVQWPDLPLDWDALPPFSRTVLQTLHSRVGRGQMVSYGWLAAKAGSPKAARAVGRAMATNPWPLVIPCHRVVGSSGALTGFGGEGGIDMKRHLLELEGALDSAKKAGAA